MNILAINNNDNDQCLAMLLAESCGHSVKQLELKNLDLIIIDCKEPDEVIKRLRFVNTDSVTKLRLLKTIEAYSDWRNFIDRNFFMDV